MKKTQRISKSAPAALRGMPVPDGPAAEPASAGSAGAGIHPSRPTFPGPIFPVLKPEDLDAVARSGVALADGVQALGQALIEMQRHTFAAGLSAARALVDARNYQDVIEVQRRFVSGSVDHAIRDSGNLAELAARVANATWAPLLPRVGAAPGGLKKPAA